MEDRWLIAQSAEFQRACRLFVGERHNALSGVHAEPTVRHVSEKPYGCSVRRRRAIRPEDITVHWHWKELPDLSREEANRLSAYAMKLLGRQLMPLLVELAVRDTLREEQEIVRPPACMLCGHRMA